MRITLKSGFLSPTDLRPKDKIPKSDIENRIENLLRKEGWRIDPNAAVRECSTMKELSAILVFLKRHNITSGIILDGL